MAALDARINDLHETEKALRMRLQSVQEELSEAYRTRYDLLIENQFLSFQDTVRR